MDTYKSKNMQINFKFISSYYRHFEDRKIKNHKIDSSFVSLYGPLAPSGFY